MTARKRVETKATENFSESPAPRNKKVRMFKGKGSVVVRPVEMAAYLAAGFVREEDREATAE
jgi:hypothetical protein